MRETRKSLVARDQISLPPKKLHGVDPGLGRLREPESQGVAVILLLDDSHGHLPIAHDGGSSRSPGLLPYVGGGPAHKAVFLGTDKSTNHLVIRERFL